MFVMSCMSGRSCRVSWCKFEPCVILTNVDYLRNVQGKYVTTFFTHQNPLKPFTFHVKRIGTHVKANSYIVNIFGHIFLTKYYFFSNVWATFVFGKHPRTSNNVTILRVKMRTCHYAFKLGMLIVSVWERPRDGISVSVVQPPAASRTQWQYAFTPNIHFINSLNTYISITIILLHPIIWILHWPSQTLVNHTLKKKKMFIKASIYPYEL